jgi:hypothetical protein
MSRFLFVIASPQGEAIQGRNSMAPWIAATASPPRNDETEGGR